MRDVPAVIPVTTPFVTVATPVDALVHVPPVGDVDNVVVEPTHRFGEPEIAAGVALTVMLAMRLHPVVAV